MTDTSLEENLLLSSLSKCGKFESWMDSYEERIRQKMALFKQHADAWGENRETMLAEYARCEEALGILNNGKRAELREHRNNIETRLEGLRGRRHMRDFR